jgi:hypothetical protein
MLPNLINVTKIARLCHEANKAYCEMLGDNSQFSWELAPKWQKESAIHGVMFHVANPDAGDDASHTNWMAEKREEGWTFGLVKNAAAKTHPCMVPFGELDPKQQYKDKLFRTIVHALNTSLPLL